MNQTKENSIQSITLEGEFTFHTYDADKNVVDYDEAATHIMELVRQRNQLTAHKDIFRSSSDQYYAEIVKLSIFKHRTYALGGIYLVTNALFAVSWWIIVMHLI